MGKKFKEYYLMGLKNSFKTLYKRKSNIFKYYVCLFIYILAMPLFLLKPVIYMATFRLGSQVNENNDIELASLVKSSDNPKNYFTALFASLIKIFIIIGIILALLLVGGILGLIGYAISIFTGENMILLMLLFASPALLAILIYIILIPLIYAEIGYIVNSNNDINASNALNISFMAYKKQGKKNRFLIIFINCLIKVLYLGIFGVIAALPIILNGYTNETLGLTVLLAILVLIPYLIFAPLFTLSTISSMTLLNDDVVNDTLTSILNATNVKFTLPKKDIEDLTTEEKLTYIFDNAADLKPNIKDLRIIDSLDIVDGDGNIITSKEIKEAKKNEKQKNIEKEVPIIKKEKEDIQIDVNEKQVDQQIDNDKEEIVERIDEVEENNSKDFEAIKEASDENITDSIVEDVNSEKVSMDVEDKHEDDNYNEESKDFEAIKDVNGQPIEENIEEEIKNIEPDETSIEVADNSETIETEKVEETINNDEVKEENEITDETVEENVEDPIEENIEEKSKEQSNEIVIEENGTTDEAKEETEETIINEEEINETQNEESEDNFSFENLFDEEKPNEDEEALSQMEEFLKKGGNE